MTQDKAETGSRINGGILRHPQASSGILRHSQALSDIPTVIPIISFLNEDIEQMFFLCEDIPTVIPIISFLNEDIEQTFFFELKTMSQVSKEV